jgi:hypothetical protein
VTLKNLNFFFLYTKKKKAAESVKSINTYQNYIERCLKYFSSDRQTPDHVDFAEFVV